MSASDLSILKARVTQLQALNRRYLDAMRDMGDEYDRQTEEYLQLHARVRELEVRPPPPPPAAAADKVLGCTRAQFLKGMEIIMRDTGKAFPEAFALWEIHAAECEGERRQEAIASGSREGLRAALGAWLSEGMPQKKAICACGDGDCPTNDLVYVEGRGFLSRWDHAEELERLEEEKAAAAAAQKEEEEKKKAAAAQKKRPMTWAERVLAGTK